VGVGAVVFNQRGEIALIKRGKPPHFGRWMIPGGSLEWGETLEQAAVREVREETGLDIEIETFVDFVEAMVPGEAGYHFLIMDYAARAVTGSLAAASDALEAEWVSSDSLAAYDLAPELLQVIDKARRLTQRTASGTGGESSSGG
jgi:8-oxo-dGTP diphosphatase